MSKKFQNSNFAHAQIAFEFPHVISMGDILDVFSALRLARDKRISASGRVSAKDGLVWEIFSKFEFRACANRRSHIFEFFASWYHISIYFHQICYRESWCDVDTHFFRQDDFFLNVRGDRSPKIAWKTCIFNFYPIWKIPKIVLVYVSSRLLIWQ